MENIQTALLLLGIGIIMVILVLWLVVGIGNLLINLTNKYITEDDNKGNNAETLGKDSKKIAAIVAAVEIATQGSGKIDSISKN